MAAHNKLENLDSSLGIKILERESNFDAKGCYQIEQHASNGETPEEEPRTFVEYISDLEDDKLKHAAHQGKCERESSLDGHIVDL